MNTLLPVTQFNLTSFTVNIVLVFIMSLGIGWHFRRFSSVFTNRGELSAIFPLLGMTIFIIINVVKSSLALSLGLVGALSIVRFRTPIKEPEELAYLFFVIAIGLGLGANQLQATLVGFVIIMLCITVLKKRKLSLPDKNGIHMSFHWNEDDTPIILEDVTKEVSKYSAKLEIKKIYYESQYTEVIYILNLKKDTDISSMMTLLRNTFKNINITCFDQKNIASP